MSILPPIGAGERGEPELEATVVAEPGAVTVIIPTFNESGNVRELLRQLTDAVPARLPCEVLFVDDSTDDTPEVIESAAQDCPFPVNVIHREKPEGGLGGAVVEGLKAAGSDWIVVMDADLQHPPALVPDLVAAGERTSADLVVASRYIDGGSRAGLAGGYRVAVSRAATWLTKGMFPAALRGISDPMSGFFAIRRSAVTSEALRPLGYKILLELAVRCRPEQPAEVPFVFRDRFAGESKSTAKEGLRFLRHLVELRTAAPLGPFRRIFAGPRRPAPHLAALSESSKYVQYENDPPPCDAPPWPERHGGTPCTGLPRPDPRRAAGKALARMIAFGLIGLTGFVPNLLALHGLTAAGVHYLPAEVMANQFGVLWNFLLIEVLLFRDRRAHRHWADRVGRFALLANADLLLRIPLIALFVAQLGMGVLTATACALLATFVLRFVGTEALVYLPKRERPGRRAQARVTSGAAAGRTEGSVRR
ncbi:glycosyltransferase family 2 protein [Streptomyces scopuliridis]|uniref:glycosyltransferase family 2 protein n=1 Tax=Streptomyces scopuliridis TaxID=452529 RepID=UPI002DD9EC89|nr:glycosyltransferase family 2 protein [Streptomyces scopuliridis]WSB33760.1 glycosyltransferase family 2 protein [Streptomyces scopuliridis]